MLERYNFNVTEHFQLMKLNIEKIAKYQQGGIVKSDNTKVVTPKITAEKVRSSEVLDDYYKAGGTEYSKHALNKQLLKYDNPKIRYAHMGNWNVGGNYQPLTNSIYINKKLQNKPQVVLEVVLAELAHIQQRQRDGALKNYGKTILDGPLKLMGKNYTTKGTYEHEAHSIIQPKIVEEYNKDYDKYKGSYDVQIEKWNDQWDADDPNRPPKPIKPKSKLDLFIEKYKGKPK